MQLTKKLNVVSLLLLLFWNCSQPNEPSHPIVGDWLWQVSSGGLGGITIRPASTQRVVLRFASDHQFSLYRNDSLMLRGRYLIGKAQSIYSHGEKPKIELQQLTTGEAKNTQPIVIDGIITELASDRLGIASNVYDGFASGYVKAKP